MLEPGYIIVISNRDHDYYSVSRVVERLTKRLYLVVMCCPEHAEPNGNGMFVLDVRLLSERHEEYGPRGQIFETKEQFLEYFERIADDAEEAPSTPSPAVH